MKNYFLAFASVLFLLGTQAKAEGTGTGGVVFNPSFFYYMDKNNSGSSTDTTTTTDIINLKLGYMTTDGIYFGAVYDIDNKSVKRTTTTDYDRKSIGASLGYISGGFQFIATYYFQSNYDISGETTKKGTGYTFDLGYIMPIGTVGVGPLLSYRTWTYTKDDDGTLDPNYKQTNIIPSIQLFLTF
jgi:hypothetical protein